MFAKLLLVILKLFKIDKILENTLSLRVAGNGTKKPVAFSQAFVNFSQFNLGFHEFRNYLNKNYYKGEKKWITRTQV